MLPSGSVGRRAGDGAELVGEQEEREGRTRLAFGEGAWVGQVSIYLSLVFMKRKLTFLHSVASLSSSIQASTLSLVLRLPPLLPPLAPQHPTTIPISSPSSPTVAYPSSATPSPSSTVLPLLADALLPPVNGAPSLRLFPISELALVVRLPLHLPTTTLLFVAAAACPTRLPRAARTRPILRIRVQALPSDTLLERKGSPAFAERGTS